MPKHQNYLSSIKAIDHTVNMRDIYMKKPSKSMRRRQIVANKYTRSIVVVHRRVSGIRRKSVQAIKNQNGENGALRVRLLFGER